MYIISESPLIFLNPLQVESIRYTVAELVLDALGNSGASAVIKMATGEEFILTSAMCNIDEAVQKLVFQIDLANGLKVASNVEPTTVKKPTPIKKGKND